MRARRTASSIALCLLAATPLPAAVTALSGATVHPVSAASIEGGTVLVENGRIVAVGADVDLPPGAEVVDLTGLHLYPALVHPSTVLGLIEVGSVRGTVDTAEIGEVNSNIRAEVAFNGDSMLLPATTSGGVLVAHVVPRGGVFTGTSALMRLDGWNWEDMKIAAPVGLHLRYPDFVATRRGFRRPSPEEVEENRRKALKLIDETLETARAYGKARRAAAAGRAPALDFDPRLEALLPLLDGEIPLHVHAEELQQIESALDWVAEQGFERVVLVAGSDAQHVAERLAREGIPVILDGVLERPRRSWEPYDAAYVAAARLHEAGVDFAIGDGGGSFGAANARNLPFHAAMAAAFGLPRDVALASVTLAPARILGVGDRLGSIEVGKEATLIATDGDPLEIRTRVERAWMAGRELDLDQDRQKALYRKYSSRPRPDAEP